MIAAAAGGRPEVFAVEEDVAQLVWRRRGASPVATDVAGLRVGRRNDFGVAPPWRGDAVHVSLRTMPPPPGPETFRFATMNDLHLGEQSFGLFRRMRETGALEPYPRRAARAALAAALEWGAQLILLKGDVTDLGRPAQWRRAIDVFGGCAVPVLAVPGNHDVSRRSVREDALLEDAGIHLAREPEAHDFAGLRVILGQSAVTGHSAGRVDARQCEQLAELAASAEGGCFVALHHQPQWLPQPLKRYHPPGIHGPESIRLLRALAEANPATVLAAGHTHRHRRRHAGPIVITEVGSPKDYPGTWAGYAVHAGGIRQVVRRIAAPDVIAWTERTARAAGGVWRYWSPGTLADRCWSHTWPGRT